MSPSDPYDDDDDIFADPVALASLAALEEQAIAASQAPRKTGYHHTVARPAAGPRARPPAPAPAPIVAPVPRPLNTNPRVGACGFGWETGGKHYTRAEQQAQQRQQQRQQQKEPLFLPAPASYDDDPVDVLVDERGQYGYTNPGAASNTSLGASTTLAKPLQRTRSISTEPKAPLPGSQARREAIEAARSGTNTPVQLPVPGARGPLSRSTSSTSTGGIPNAPALGVNRTLSRSASTGQQVFARGAPTRAPGLAPISSQGTPPSSQGAAARRAVVELDEERRLREKAEAEARELRARLAELDGTDVDDVVKLRRELYAANGQVKIVRDNARNDENRFKEEIRRLREANQDLEQRMKVKEIESKQKVEAMRTQAVFSNHNALASASKARQQSQFMASQGQSTPIKMGSPLRNKTAAVTPAPLIHSVKAKPHAPPPPRFETLANAFNMTPTVTRKRQRTEALSPVTTPKKQRSGSQPPSPMVVSPLASPAQSQQSQRQSQMDIDVEMDWQPDFGEPLAPQDVQLVAIQLRDERAELVHHIVMHQTLSPALDERESGEPVSTIVRIARTAMPQHRPDLPRWDTMAHELLSVCSNPRLTFDEASTAVMAVFAEILSVSQYWELDDEKFAAWLFNMIYVLRLTSSTILLFPSLVAANPEATKVISATVWIGSRLLLPAVQKSVDYSDEYAAELADAVVELAEALCLADTKRLWLADQLAVVIQTLVQSENPAVAARGLDLFVVASCYQDNFQAILFPSDQFASDTPVIDRVARFLAYGHPKFTPEKFARSSVAALGGLFMLSKHDPDAIVLLTGHSILIPSLLMVLHRESTRLWGVRTHTTATHNPLEILLPALILLHHLVYPAPQPKMSASQAGAPNIESTLFAGPRPQGVDLRRRLHETGSTKEFNGIQHVFVTALGAMAYNEADPVDVDMGSGPGAAKKDWSVDLRTVQYLAQDLLDGVVEGPEGDQVFELYAPDAEDDAAPNADPEEEEYGEEEMMLGGPEWAELSQE